MASFQGSLFDTATEPRLRPLAGALRRTRLSDGAWIDQLPEWVERADLLFESLVDDVAWRSEERVMYDRKVEVPDWSRRTAGEFSHRIRPSVRRWHGSPTTIRGPRGGSGDDRALPLPERLRTAWRGMATLSGAEPPRTRWLPSCPWAAAGGWPSDRSKADSPSLRLELGGGDLLVMGGSCQRTWEHAVPKTARPVGPRLSVQFRPSGVQ